MASRAAVTPIVAARQIAPDVFCLGPSGRTQTDCYLVTSGSSWVLIDADWIVYRRRIRRRREAGDPIS